MSYNFGFNFNHLVIVSWWFPWAFSTSPLNGRQMLKLFAVGICHLAILSMLFVYLPRYVGIHIHIYASISLLPYLCVYFISFPRCCGNFRCWNLLIYPGGAIVRCVVVCVCVTPDPPKSPEIPQTDRRTFSSLFRLLFQLEMLLRYFLLLFLFVFSVFPVIEWGQRTGQARALFNYRTPVVLPQIFSLSRTSMGVEGRKSRKNTLASCWKW